MRSNPLASHDFARRSGVAILISTLLLGPLVPGAAPCTSPPVTSPNVKILATDFTLLPTGVFFVDFAVCGYMTEGGTPGQFCTCAFKFNLPPGGGLSYTIDAVSLVAAGTNVPYPGWMDWAASTTGDAAWSLSQGGNWISFTAPVGFSIPAGDMVDLLVTVRGEFQDATYVGLRVDGADVSMGAMGGQAPPSGPPILQSMSVDGIMEEFMQILAQMEVGTDEANALGEPQGAHLAVVAAGPVTMSSGPLFDDLGGGAPAVTAPAILWATGAVSSSGSTGDARLSGGLPNAPVTFVFGYEKANTPAGSWTLIPSMDVTLQTVTDGLGNASVPLPTMPLGPKVFIQTFQHNGAGTPPIVGSNALKTLVQR